jgi:hypothetical protein
MTWSRAKYRPVGRRLSLAEAIDHILGGNWLYANGRVYHPAVLANWSLNTLRCADLRLAIENKETNA